MKNMITCMMIIKRKMFKERFITSILFLFWSMAIFRGSYGRMKFTQFTIDSNMENIIAKNNFGQRIDGIRSLVQCVGMCFSSEDCTSVFYNSEEKKCIHQIGSFNENSLFEEGIGWMYYDIKQNKKACNGSGYLDTFTRYKDRLHIGYDLLVFNAGGSSEEENIELCKSACLGEPTCRAFEMRFLSVCILEAIDMYDKPLDHSSEFNYFNRDYDCGCPPRQHRNLIFYESTTDGSTATYVCPKDGTRNVSVCTSAGWGILTDSISC